MDQELAQAVFKRWEEGLPVYEGTFYKAAEVMGLDPDDALAEARFYTNLDRFLIEKRAMTFHEKAYFSTAAGENPLELVKTANQHGLSHEELIIEALHQRDFVPDLVKLAFMGMQGGPTEGPAMGGEGQPNPPQGGPGGFASAPVEPQPGAQVQQQPDARAQAGYQPGPTAPQQSPPSAQGNLQDLLQGASQADAAPMGDGLPPSGMGAQQTPPPPTAEEKLQQAFGGQLDPDSLSRYAPELEKFENQIGMSINDPKQIEKFVKEIQKGEKKMVDEAIKQFGQQKAQEQQAASGMGAGGAGGMAGGASTASFDPTAPTPKAQSGGGEAAPPPEATAEPEGEAPPSPPPGGNKKQPSGAKGGGADPSQQAQAMAKVASAARVLARAVAR